MHAVEAGPQSTPLPERNTLIHAGTLLLSAASPPGTRQTLHIQGTRIKAVHDGILGSEELGLAAENTEAIDLLDRFVMPGLIDAHVHLTLSPEREANRFETTGEEMLIEGIVNARRTLRAGFTTVRDLGARPYSWPVIVLRDAIAQGRIDGPRVLAAGGSISATGGHADILDRPGKIAFRLETPGVCDGVAACRKAVRAQFRQGANLVKINATGGGGERNGGKDDPPAFLADEFQALVETARSLRLKVAAHAHGRAGINAALKAGADSIEHGSFLDEESIALFRQTGAYLVPTLSVQDVISREVDGASGAMQARMRDFLRHHPENVGRAYRAGVRIALGTDAGVVTHGQNARELEWLVGAGMTNADAIRAATTQAAAVAGPRRRCRLPGARQAGGCDRRAGRPACGRQRSSRRFVRDESRSRSTLVRMSETGNGILNRSRGSMHDGRHSWGGKRRTRRSSPRFTTAIPCATGCGAASG